MGVSRSSWALLALVVLLASRSDAAEVYGPPTPGDVPLVDDSDVYQYADDDDHDKIEPHGPLTRDEPPQFIVWRGVGLFRQLWSLR